MNVDAARVVVYEDQTTLRVGISHVLKDAGLDVVHSDGLPSDGNVPSRLKEVEACVVGMGLDRFRAVEAINAVLERHKKAAIVVMGSNDPLAVVSRAYEAGARAYVNGAAPETYLVEAVRAVVSSPGLYYPPGLAEPLLEFYITGAWQLDPSVLLSDTDLKIFRMLAEGKRHRDIADAVGVTATSIGNRASHIRAQLQIQRDEFTAVALRYNLITGSDSRSQVTSARPDRRGLS